MKDINSILSLWYSKIVFKIANPEVKTKLRAIENVAIKLLQTRSHRQFNECCIINNLLPLYSNIYIYIYIATVGIYTRLLKQLNFLYWDI